MQEKELMKNLRPLLPSKYQFHITGPVIFVCTRIGEIGSALFSETKDVDEQDVTFSKEEAIAQQHAYLDTLNEHVSSETNLSSYDVDSASLSAAEQFEDSSEASSVSD